MAFLHHSSEKRYKQKVSLATLLLAKAGAFLKGALPVWLDMEKMQSEIDPWDDSPRICEPW